VEPQRAGGVDAVMLPQSPNLRITAETPIARGTGTLTRVTYERRSQDGHWKRLRREIYDNGDSAVALPYDGWRGTVLLARQSRIPPFLSDGRETMLEACAGKLDGEAPEVRIRKELEEELGFRIATVERLFSLFMSPAGFQERITFFLCDYTPQDRVSAGGGLAAEGEDITVVEMPLEEAWRMVAAGEIADAKTVILIQQLMLRRGGEG